MLSLLNNKQQKKESFWAILLEDNWISSAVWQINDGKVQIISQGLGSRYEIDTAGDGLLDELVEAVDVSLSAVIQNLPEDFEEPAKTVFGVPPSWVDGGSIKPEYLTKLKKVCDGLSLVPSGFVVISEAISHYLKYEEEASFSGIILGLSDQKIDVSIFTSGKLHGTTIVARSVSVVDDLIEGLSRLSSGLENFPSRIVVYNQKEDELNEVKDNLNSSEWKEVGGVTFAHPPKVDIFDPKNKLSAICLAGGSEIGAVDGVIGTKEAAQSITETEMEPVDNLDQQETEQIPDNVDELNEADVTNVSVAQDLTMEDLGFTKVDTKTTPVNIPRNISLPSVDIKKLPKINFPKFKFATGGYQKTLIILVASLSTFFIAAFLFWWFAPSADITIYVSPKKIDESISLDLDSSLETNEIKVVMDGEKTKSTTGTKTVGEKAKGSVKIQNGTANAVNLPSGTVLVSSSDLRFQTIKQASVSGAVSPSDPGTTTVEVEALSIGSEYNLSKDEVFKVSNYPKAEVDATVVENLTGGSSRQISSVSEKDRESLLEDLLSELSQKAKLDLEAKVNTDEYLIESSLEVSSQDEDFSNRVGDEATSLKLKLNVEFVAKVAKKAELSSLARTKLEDKVSAGFVLKDDQIKYDFDIENETLRVSANLIPDINTDEIAKKISGKYTNVAETYLGTIPGFVNAEFRLRPRLPEKVRTLPHIQKNINIVISAKE